MSIEINNLSYTYMKKTPFEKTALENINLIVNEGEYLAIAGHTGSGKSTLIQLMAGLIKASEGSVTVDDVDLTSKNKSAVREARLKVGMVFQYPETQLFEETVERDIAFGAKNLNLSAEEVDKRVTDAMKLVNLPEELKEESPFNLSGGLKRRAAIAGVLVMRPKYLILDEPTAGLDPRAREKMMQNIKMLHDRGNVTIILVSHSMDDIARFADRVVILSQGRILTDGTPREVFKKLDILKTAGLAPPSAMQFLLTLKENGIDVDTDAITIDEAEECLCRAIECQSLR